MITEKMNIRMDSVFSDDKKHRFLLRRSWARDGKIATVIMINPNKAECLITDTTSVSVYNGIAKMEGYAALNIVNLYSAITPKIHFRHNREEDLNHPDNDKNILKAVAESDVTILAWGTVADNNNRVKQRVLDLMEKLKDYKDKLFVVGYGGKYGLHPLSPQLRCTKWKMQQIDYDTYVKELKEALQKSDTKEAAKPVNAKEVKGKDTPKAEPKEKETETAPHTEARNTKETEIVSPTEAENNKETESAKE